MRLLVDEQLGPTLIAALREAGHDLRWVRDVVPGSADTAVLALAVRQRRVAVTAGLDFGELVVRRGLPHAGVLVLRLPRPTPSELAGRAVKVLRTYGPHVPGALATVDPLRVRIRLPASGQTRIGETSAGVAEF